MLMATLHPDVDALCCTWREYPLHFDLVASVAGLGGFG
jgi:hypothetical protein